MTKAMAWRGAASRSTSTRSAPAISTPRSTTIIGRRTGPEADAYLPRKRVGRPEDLDALLVLLASGRAISSTAPSSRGTTVRNLMKLKSPRTKLVLKCAFPIRWGDMDAMGHLNKQRISATSRPSASTGCGPLAASPDRRGGNGHRQRVLQLHSMEYPASADKMYVSDAGRTSFESGHDGAPDSPGVIYAAGGATTVWVNFRPRIVALPDWMRRHLSDISAAGGRRWS